MIHQGKKYLCLFADMTFQAYKLLTDKLLLVVIVVKVKMWTDFVRWIYLWDTRRLDTITLLSRHLMRQVTPEVIHAES